MVDDRKEGEEPSTPSSSSNGETSAPADSQQSSAPAPDAPVDTMEAPSTTGESPASEPETKPAASAAVATDGAGGPGEQTTKASTQPLNPGAGGSGRRVYQASAVRKTLMSFVFLILLPFFASLPAMMVQRIMHQLWPDMLGFTIFAAAFTAVMLLVFFELLRSIRARVVIGESAVQLTLPAGRGIAMPKLFYKTHTIPYSDIEAVETRRELYGGIIAPVMLRGARIVTKGGQKIPLGYVSEANTDPALPVPEIAAEIARRAGLEVIDHGTVRRQVHKKIRGIRANDGDTAPVTEADIAALNRRHNKVMLAVCGALFVIVAGGLLLDISKSDLDLGERAQQFVQQLIPSPDVQRAGTQP